MIATWPVLSGTVYAGESPPLGTVETAALRSPSPPTTKDCNPPGELSLTALLKRAFVIRNHLDLNKEKTAHYNILLFVG